MRQSSENAVVGLADTLVWRKSSYSNPSGNCVELAVVPRKGIAMRNSRDPHGAVLVFAATEVAAFVASAKDGHFDDLGLEPAPAEASEG